MERIPFEPHEQVLMAKYEKENLIISAKRSGLCESALARRGLENMSEWRISSDGSALEKIELLELGTAVIGNPPEAA
jgi:hypothetical protein